MSFPRYPKYKASGVEWLGDVPEHWQVNQLKRIAKLTTGMTPPTEELDNYTDHPEFQWVRPEDLNESGAPTIASKFITQKGWEQTRRVSSTSSLICCIGTIGKVGFVADEVSTNQQITAASFKRSARYFYHSLCAAKTELELASTGNVLRILNSERLGNVSLPCPAETEANVIASFLDRETSKIDGLVGEQRRLIELLKEKRQAVISHAVTKGLNPHAPLKPSGIEWLGDVPEHWAIPAVFTRYHAVLGKMVDEKQLTGTHPICYLRNADVNWDRINITDLPVFDIEPDDVERFSLRPGDVLICEGGAGIGQTAIWQGELDRCAFQKALHRLRPWSDDEDPRFFYYCMRNAVETGVVLAGGTATIPHLTGEQLRKYRFPRPPIKEQKQIVEHLDSETDKLDALTAEAERGIELLQERRTALISAAVTGQIDVRGMAETEAA